MEKKNYLWLSPSKIRNCSLGPELSLTESFKSLSGTVSISRKGNILWEKTIHTGEDHITHSLENLEYHHFKHDNHRLPWDVHIHFFGADAFSYGAGVQLERGDLMNIQWDGTGFGESALPEGAYPLAELPAAACVSHLLVFGSIIRFFNLANAYDTVS